MIIADLLFAGMMNSITNGPIMAILQSVVASDMQGRVSTVVGSLTGLASPPGLAVAGPVAEHTGRGRLAYHHTQYRDSWEEQENAHEDHQRPHIPRR